MNEVFEIDPNDVPKSEFAQWDEILIGILDKGINWVSYAEASDQMIVLVQLYSKKYSIHVSPRGGYRTFSRNKVVIKTLEQLKVMALKVMVTS